METTLPNWNIGNGNGMLYSLLLIVSIAAINLNIIGSTARSGAVLSRESLPTEQQPAEESPAVADTLGETRKADGACNDCGVVEAINEIQVKRKGLSLGSLVGGTAGVLLSNQVGIGDGNTVAMVAGAAGGAHVGSEIDSNIHRIVRYWVRVRMNDGTPRICYQLKIPTFEIGDLVRIVNGQIVAAG